MRKITVVLICMLCILSGCGKSKAETKTYIIPENVCFEDDDTERERRFTAKQIKRGYSLEESINSVEDAYINEDGDMVIVMTLEQSKESREGCLVLLYTICSTFFEDDLLSYYYNNACTELYMEFASKEAYMSENNQSQINNILSLMLMQQIYEDIDAADAAVTFNIEFEDTGETETVVYKCEDMPLVK